MGSSDADAALQPDFHASNFAAYGHASGAGKSLYLFSALQLHLCCRLFAGSKDGGCILRDGSDRGWLQWVRSGRFRLYDYGSSAANQRHYNEPEPCDVAEHYGLLDCPVDIMAGRADGVIAPQNVLQHYDRMRAAGAAVTYKEFNFGHLDFTFALKEELVYYVRSRLRMRHDSRQQPGISGPVF